MADTKSTAPKKTAAPKAAPKTAKPSVETQPAAPTKAARSHKSAPETVAVTPVETAAAAPEAPASLAEKTGRKAGDVSAVTALAAPVEASETSAALDQAEIDRMIAEAAYYLAEKRDFQPGHEAEDWAIATEQVMASLRGDA